MDMEVVTNAIVIAGIPIGIYLYHAYVKATAKDSPGGESITHDELAEIFSDPEFWALTRDVKDMIEE